jgi:DNA-binding HxlR family transcriptional regulator
MEILLLLDESPMSFNELARVLKAYPDTLTRRLKEMKNAGLITDSRREEKLRYELTEKGRKAAKLVKDLRRILDELNEVI